MRFGVFEVDLQTGAFRKRGRRVQLQEQPFQILAMLLQRPGEIVTRDEIRKRLWAADTYVDFDHGLNSAMGRLREALNDSAGAPHFIETVPRKGYRFIAQLDLQESIAPVPKQRFPGILGRPVGMIVGFSFLVLLIATILWLFVRKRMTPLVTSMEVLPLAGLAGEEQGPEFSPDGRQVAFYVFHGPEPGIYTALVGGEKSLRLTTDFIDCCPAWSPNGGQIAFLRVTNDQFGLYVVSALGGTERLLYRGPRPLNPSLAWSPNGQILAFTEGNPQTGWSGIALLSLADFSVRRLTSPADGFRDNGARFSPDGTRVAFIRGTIAGVVNDIFTIPMEGGNSERLTFDACQTFGLSWTADGREIVYSSVRGGQPGLWRISATGGTPSPVAGSGLMAYSPAVSRSGNLLAYEQGIGKDNIWQIHLKDEKHSQGRPVLVVSAKGSKLRPQFSPDGKRISFESNRLGNTDIWSCDNDGANCAQLTALHGTAGTSHWSPDGRSIAFEFHPGSRAEIYVLDIPGGTPRLLPTIPGADNLVPSWSRDGQWIYFASKQGAAPFQLWKVRPKGGMPVPITKNGGVAAVESVDGRFLYYSKYESTGIWKMPVTGGEETRILGEAAGHAWYTWALGPKGIYYIWHNARNQIVVNFFDFANNNITTVDIIDKPIGMGLALSPDSKALLFVGSEYAESNIMVVKNFR